MKKVTVELIKSLCPNAVTPEKLVEAFTEYGPRYGLNTPERVAMFLAQCAHESGGFRIFVENLNYSARGLRNTWPSRFPTDAIALKYARQPRAIANKVYADRYGNGGEASGMGFLYRGRGLKQLTFKNNYAKFEKDTGIPALKNPDILMSYPEALISALWYWGQGNPTGKSLNTYADKKDVKGCTKLINGGYIGLAERTALFNKFLEALK